MNLDKAKDVVYEAYANKDYKKAIDIGLPELARVQAKDGSGKGLSLDTLELCCVVVSFVGQSLEKVDREQEAVDLYDWITLRGCIGLLPFTRLAIILERQKQYEKAIEVCDRAINNRFSHAPTAQRAQADFSKRKTRLLNKAQVPKEDRGEARSQPKPKRKVPARKTPPETGKLKSPLYVPYQSYFGMDPMSD